MKNHIDKFIQLILNYVENLKPILRFVIPPSARGALRKSLDSCYDRFARDNSHLDSANNALSDFQGLLRREAFLNGEILSVNNALSWGGVERQIVYLLQGLPRYTQRKLGLLCNNLHAGKDYQFYLPMLENYLVDISNLGSIRRAKKRLKQDLTAEEREQVYNLLSFLPPDTKLLTIRYIAEFLVRRPAVVHAWQDVTSIAAGLAAVLVGVPRVVLSSRNVRPTHFAYYRPYMYHAYKQLAEYSRVVLVNNSDFGAADYADWLGLPVECYKVKRNGIDTEKFCKAPVEEQNELRKKLGIPTNAPLVGSIFRLYPEKRPLLWVDMAKLVLEQHPDTHFVVFGTGVMLSDIQKYARKSGLNDRLHLPGTIQNAALALSMLDIFVLTSSFEGTPNTVLEAELTEVPVVVTDAGGAKETLVSGKTGWLISDPEPRVIAGYVTKLLSDPVLSKEMGQAGKQFVQQNYGLERMVQDTISLYQLEESAGANS